MTLFLIFLFLAVYNAGCMTTLQLQHYGIYPFVGRESFARYMQANNRAAAIPTIIPAMLLLIASLALAVERPPFMRTSETVTAVVLNVLALASTFLWQRPLQGEMAVSGFDEQRIQKLVSTNWIRTVCYLLLAVMAVAIVARLEPAAALQLAPQK